MRKMHVLLNTTGKRDIAIIFPRWSALDIVDGIAGFYNQ